MISRLGIAMSAIYALALILATAETPFQPRVALVVGVERAVLDLDEREPARRERDEDLDVGAVLEARVVELRDAAERDRLVDGASVELGSGEARGWVEGDPPWR